MSEEFPDDLSYLNEKLEEVAKKRSAMRKMELADTIYHVKCLESSKTSHLYNRWFANQKRIVLSNKDDTIKEETVFEKLINSQTVFQRLRTNRK